MITGFNTDIEHGGITYHVQTEDKGLENPILLSLVYVGGAILASKRTPYDDLVADGLEEKTLADRLQRQHTLIIAAIRAGRIEDLKRMGARDGAEQPPAESKQPRAESEKPERPPESRARPEERKKPSSILDLITESSVPIIPEGIEVSRGQVVAVEVGAVTPAREVENGFAGAFTVPVDGDDEELFLNLVDDEGDFRAGQLATIKVYVGRGRLGRSCVPDAGVTVKVLGTTFRPMILSTQTDGDGLAVVRALLPHFTSGRAAILIRATDSRGEAAELRRIIHQA